MITANSYEEQSELTTEFDDTIWYRFPEWMEPLKSDISKLWLNYSKFNDSDDQPRMYMLPKTQGENLIPIEPTDRTYTFECENKRHRDFGNSENNYEISFNVTDYVIKLNYNPWLRDGVIPPTGFVQLQPREYLLNDSNLISKVRKFINQAIKNNDILDRTYNF